MRRRSRATTPSTDLNKVKSTKLAESGSSGAQLIKNFTWTNDDQNHDQNLAVKYITADGMKPADAAKKWVEANHDKVNAGLAKS